MSAAFFDIDGTLLAKPSLERRLFRDLAWQRKISAGNYLRWLAEAARLGVQDPRMAVHSNKAYLRGLREDELSSRGGSSRLQGGIRLFPPAVQRVWWHAMRGDRIVLVTGTLEPLAERVKFALEREMLCRGVDINITLLATRLEVRNRRFTGRVLGSPMFAQEKARAIQEFSERTGIMLSQCSAYGDSALDLLMLAAVGHPVAVNADVKLKTIAHLRRWPAVSWNYHACSIRFGPPHCPRFHWNRRSETVR